METRIGTCSLCNGPVIVDPMTISQTPHCKGCGAVKSNPWPTIEMDPKPRSVVAGAEHPSWYPESKPWPQPVGQMWRERAEELMEMGMNEEEAWELTAEESDWGD